ncbi:unnamed protein product [Rhizoctonia solani]|uniref:Uncharacterized protein n=1 Tax=Rhizoctonia solani TaxID=456999 RepID=A0A8H3AXA2_9AGAM|nr:unnamed protein product [Rhizoctonia solani]CAE7217840.1 unnamed protein product [Rhizoctonia solani]
MSLATIYNSLPSVEFASDAFKDRDATFAKLAPLLATYDFQFGVCLVHRHCEIEDGEAMVADGNVSRPVRGGPQYPERWLPDGTPYEFNQEPTKSPPAELVRDFQTIVGKDALLGLYYSGDNHEEAPVPVGKTWFERTQGRDNIMELVDSDNLPEHIETGWIPGAPAPVTMTCSPFSHNPHPALVTMTCSPFSHNPHVSHGGPPVLVTMTCSPFSHNPHVV